MLVKIMKCLMLHFPFYVLLTHPPALPLQPPQVLLPSTLAFPLGYPVPQSAPNSLIQILWDSYLGSSEKRSFAKMIINGVHNRLLKLLIHLKDFNKNLLIFHRL